MSCESDIHYLEQKVSRLESDRDALAKAVMALVQCLRSDENKREACEEARRFAEQTQEPLYLDYYDY